MRNILAIILLGLACNLHTSYTLEWNTCGELPKGIILSSAVYDGLESIFLLGGLDADYNKYHEPLYEIRRFNIHTYESIVVGKFSKPVHAGGATITEDGRIFYFGGGGWNPTEVFTEIYHLTPSSPIPTVVGHLPEPSTGMTALAIGESIYLFGGSRTHEQIISNHVYRFNTNTYKITELDPLPQPITYATGITDHTRGILFVFGGNIGAPSKATNQILTFDTKTEKASIHASNLKSKFYRSSSVLIGDWVFLIGGQLHGSSEVKKLTKFNIATGEVIEKEVNGIKQFQIDPTSALANGTIFTFRGLGPKNGKVLCFYP